MIKLAKTKVREYSTIFSLIMYHEPTECRLSWFSLVLCPFYFSSKALKLVMKGLAENERSLANCSFCKKFLCFQILRYYWSRKKNVFVQMFKNNKAKDFIINYDLFCKINFTELCSDRKFFFFQRTRFDFMLLE